MENNIPNYETIHIIVTDHALDMYRERINHHAVERDVAAALRTATLIPKNKDAWYSQTILAHTERGCSYFYNADQNVLFVTAQGRNAKTHLTRPGELHIRIITVFFPEDRAQRQERSAGHVPPAPEDTHPPDLSLAELRDAIRTVERRIVEHAPGSVVRRELGRQLQDLQRELFKRKAVRGGSAGVCCEA